MSLADELLADLEGAETSEELIADSSLHELEDVTLSSVNKLDDFLSDGTSSGVKSAFKATSFADAPISAYAKLRNSDKLTKVMSDLDYFANQKKSDRIHGPVEADPEYQCIVEANNLMVEIDNEIRIRNCQSTSCRETNGNWE
uniref:Uncharacterized protein n=1 Tax=Trichobilharzia regenti TaxID=157069 RepID=A0AA85JA94_TRIRE|nr:unnamed protein product [Trichobilharzia regenti]